jgi:hypothetical protein|nr:MAG TPA: chromosome partitioning protein [Caudoviricetes sp.]
METIKQISIELIDPHPENPRKNLGNLTELAESIKANGIMQNLTVVPKDDGRYMAVIGHRRLAAAKLAGLETVPCAVDRELQNIEKQKKKQQWIDYLENKGVRPIPEEECRDAWKIYNSIKNFNYSAVRPEELELPEETPLNETFYKFEAWGNWIYFYKKKPETEVNDEAEASRKRAEEFRIAKNAELDEMFDCFNERVKAFVDELSEDKKTLPIVLRLFVEIQISGGCYNSVEDTEFCEAAGIDWEEANITDEEIIAGKLNPEILYNIDRKPAVFLLKAILCLRSIKTYKSYSGEYDEDLFSLCAVKALKSLGFKLTKEEQRLIDGTHEIYGRTCEDE